MDMPATSDPAPAARQPAINLWQIAMLVLAGLSLAAICAFAATMLGAFASPGDKPIALDFVAFWSAAKLTLLQGAHAAFDERAIDAFERAHTAMPAQGTLIFYYPPTFLLFCLPFGLLAYVPALFAFEAMQAALLWPLCRRIAGAGWDWLPILAAPGFLMNVFSGQNGGFSASCLGAALVTLDRWPWLGGACLGLLSCKPQLAVCVPVALLAARRWRACLAALASAGVLAAVATAALGTGAWRAFLANAPGARASIETLPIKWPMMQSFYGAARLMGLSTEFGYAVQFTVAVLAVALLAWLCWQRPGAGAEGAALATAALLVTPYLYDYDLVVFAAPIAWMAREGRTSGWLAGEKALLLLLYLVPLAARAAGTLLGVTLAPLLTAAMLLAIARRVARTQGWGAARRLVQARRQSPDLTQRGAP